MKLFYSNFVMQQTEIGVVRECELGNVGCLIRYGIITDRESSTNNLLNQKTRILHFCDNYRSLSMCEATELCGSLVQGASMEFFLLRTH